MRLLWNGGLTDARLNLALEEYALRHFQEDDYLLLYVNAPSIILGRNQSALDEIDSRFVTSRGIPIVRRMSGGGAVYHDTGNLNFSLITPYTPERFNRYDEVTRPVVEVLREFGMRAMAGGRNDILVDGRKISGNAQYVSKGRMFSHGTLLVGANLDDVARALRPRPGKVASNGTQSVRDRVANLEEFLPERMPLSVLRQQILRRIVGEDISASTRILTPAEWRGVHELASRKYGAWDWNYGRSPRFSRRRWHRFGGGEVDARIVVDGSRIVSVRLLGDYLGRLPVAELEHLLAGVPCIPDALRDALATVSVSEYLGGVTNEELIDLIAG